ncbi:MAG: hypothetical protein DRN04_02955 [Thermoprotei archaeon]|nr:MAG: hypothetical protein DRN04_02955 [Thermoprotei archaeon]
MVMGKPLKIEFFKSKTCVVCPKVRELLKKILAEKGLRYEEVVIERDISEDPEALTDLLMLNALSVPVVKIKDTILYEQDAVKEDKLREAVEKFLYQEN